MRGFTFYRDGLTVSCVEETEGNWTLSVVGKDGQPSTALDGKRLSFAGGNSFEMRGSRMALERSMRPTDALTLVGSNGRRFAITVTNDRWIVRSLVVGGNANQLPAIEALLELQEGLADSRFSFASLPGRETAVVVMGKPT